MEIKGCVCVILVLCLSGFVQGDDDAEWRCPQDLPDTTAMYVYNDQCYQFVDEEVHWVKAMSYCMNYGGHLVQIKDPDTNQFLVDALNTLPWNNRGIWIGLHDRNGELEWEWVTSSPLVGENLSWSNWGPGHPRGLLHRYRDCVRIQRGRDHDWSWHETPCALLNWKYRYICQYEASPTTTPAPAPRGKSMQRNYNVALARRVESYQEEEAGEQDSWIDVASVLVREEPMLGAMAAQKAGPEEYRKPAYGSTVAVICLICSMFGVLLLALLLFARRRRRQQPEAFDDDPTLRLDNPTYSTRGDQTVNVYTNPMELSQKLNDLSSPSKSNMDFSVLQKSGDFSKPSVEEWDYINTMLGPLEGVLSTSSNRSSHIYEDIPANTTVTEISQEVEVDDDVYEALENNRIVAL